MSAQIELKTKSSDECKKTFPTMKREEMERAAAAAVVLALIQSGESMSVMRLPSAASNGHASAWILQARIAMTGRWPH